MANKTKIQWTESTWNPWIGCQKVSEGCKYCYMHRMRDGQNPSQVYKTSKLNDPKGLKEPTLIFTCSMSDWFIKGADVWRDDAWKVIRDTPHTYQILTKRPERIKDNLPDWFDEISDRVLIGVSIEMQKHVDRLDFLKDLPCKTFVSFEPLIGEIQWDKRMNNLDWNIIGGESGNDYGKYRYRPMQIDWMEHLLSQSVRNGVPCFIKQLGSYQAKQLKLKDKKGGEMEEWPNNLKVRQYPKQGFFRQLKNWIIKFLIK